MYLIYRWLIASFFVFKVVYSIVNSIVLSEINVYMIYLTNQSLIFSTVALLTGATLVHLHHFDSMKVPQKMTRALKFYWFMSNQGAGYAFLVTFSYWLFVYDGSQVDAINILVHGTNSAALLIDLLIVRHPQKFVNFPYSLIISVTYITFTVVYTLLGGVNKLESWV